MAYTTPPTKAVNDLLTASDWNTYIRDNLEFFRQNHGPLWIPARELIGTGTLATLGTEPNAIETWALINSFTFGGHATRQVPDDWISGGFTVKIHWAPNSTNTGVVRFVLNYAFLGLGELVTVAGTELVVEPAADGVTSGINIDAFAATAAPTAGELIRVDVRREGAHANDTFTGTAQIVALELEYE